MTEIKVGDKIFDNDPRMCGGRGRVQGMGRGIERSAPAKEGKMTMDIAELEQRAREANKALWDARDAETRELNRHLVGKCFKSRNSFSCPEKGRDYWLVYYKVLSVDGAVIVTNSFQTDCNGSIRVDFSYTLYWPQGPSDEYQLATTGEFNKVWRALQKRIAKHS